MRRRSGLQTNVATALIIGAAAFIVIQRLYGSDLFGEGTYGP